MVTAMNSSYQPRLYRDFMGKDRFEAFTVCFKETDLWIGVDPRHYCESMKEYALEQITKFRTQLEGYIQKDPGFLTSLKPYKTSMEAPCIARSMAEAAAKAGVGPMAAVAGAFSRKIGRLLERAYGLEEIVVENGGDIYIRIKEPAVLSVYAGNSRLSGKIAIEIPPSLSPLGVCTSSGKVGHSMSFGRADAVTVICRDAASADAYATYLGNIVRSGEDIESVLNMSSKHEDILGVLIIAEDKLGVRGHLKLVPL
jgi:hypothetical protein